MECISQGRLYLHQEWKKNCKFAHAYPQLVSQALNTTNWQSLNLHYLAVDPIPNMHDYARLSTLVGFALEFNKVCGTKFYNSGVEFWVQWSLLSSLNSHVWNDTLSIPSLHGLFALTCMTIKPHSIASAVLIALRIHTYFHAIRSLVEKPTQDDTKVSHSHSPGEVYPSCS